MRGNRTIRKRNKEPPIWPRRKAAAPLKGYGVTGRTSPPAPPSDERDGEHKAAGAQGDSQTERVAHDAFHDLFLLFGCIGEMGLQPHFASAT